MPHRQNKKKHIEAKTSYEGYTKVVKATPINHMTEDDFYRWVRHFSMDNISGYRQWLNYTFL